MDAFFNRSPDKVATDLRGKILEVNGKSCIIMRSLPLTREDNARWLASKPLFGFNRVGFYVSRFRSACLAFLTNEPDTCNRIEEVSLDGELISGPGRVCKALGLDREATGDASVESNRVIITLHDPPQLRR